MTGTIAGLLLAVAASTQEPELASELVERGWIDLAEDLCKKDGSPLARDPYTLGLISAAKAREDQRIDRAVPELNAAIERFGKVGRPLKNNERALFGQLQVQKARLLQESAESAQAWLEAETYYRAVIADFAKRPSAPDVDELLLEFRLELPRVLMGKAKSMEAEAPRKALLEEAVRLLQDYQLDTGAMPVAFEALLEEGRARVEMKDYAKAERCFRAVLGLKKDARALKGYPAMLWDAAFANLIGALTRSGKAKEAAALCDRFLRDHPMRARSVMGKSVLLSQAEALQATGDLLGAIGLAQKVVGLDPDGPIGRAARERVRDWMKSGFATPDRVLLVADGLLEQGRYREALIDLRRCVEICSGAAERAKYEPLSAFKRGECFRALKQEAEAAVAFTDVFRKFPKHDLASRAAFEAVRSLSHVALATRDARDQERQEQILQEVLRLDLRGFNGPVLTFIQAEILDRKGQWKAAADLYRQVDPGSELHDEALLNAGHGYRRDAESKGAKGGEEAAGELKLAEDLLRRALARLERTPDSKLLPSAEFELASVCLSDAVRKPREALAFLDRCSGRLAPGHDLQARLGEMAIRAQIALEDLPAAAERLARLEKAFPDSPLTARSARRIALKQEASDPAAALKSYQVWLDRTETAAATTGELQSVANALVRIARTLNHFEDRVVSVVDLRGKAVPDPRPWREAATALTRLAAAPDLPAKDQVGAESQLAWSLGLSAGTAEDWDRLKRHCDRLIAKYQLMAPGGGFNAPVLQNQRWLAGIVLEYGHALVQLGRAGQKYQFGNALTVFNGLLPMTEVGKETWWIAQTLVLTARFERGEEDDLRVAEATLSLIERNHPEFDGGKYGMRDPLLRLKEELKAVRSPHR